MNQSLEGFYRGMAELHRAAEKMRKSAEEVQLAAEEMASVRATIADAHQHFEKLIGPARELSESVRQSASQFTAAWRDGREVVAQTQQIAASMVTQQKITTAAWEDYRLRFEGIDRALDKAFQHLSEGLDGYTGKTTQFAKDLDSHASKAIDTLRTVLEELDATPEALRDMLARGRK